MSAYLPVPFARDQVDYICAACPAVAPADAEQALRWARQLAMRWVGLLAPEADPDEFMVEAVYRTLLAARDYQPGRATFATFASKRVRGWLHSRVEQSRFYGKARDQRRPELLPLEEAAGEAVNPLAVLEERLWAEQVLSRVSRRQRRWLEARMEQAGPDDSAAGVRRLHRQGLSCREIGRRLGRDHHWVKRRLEAGQQ